MNNIRRREEALNEVNNMTDPYMTDLYRKRYKEEIDEAEEMAEAQEKQSNIIRGIEAAALISSVVATEELLAYNSKISANAGCRSCKSSCDTSCNTKCTTGCQGCKGCGHNCTGSCTGCSNCTAVCEGGHRGGCRKCDGTCSADCAYCDGHCGHSCTGVYVNRKFGQPLIEN